MVALYADDAKVYCSIESMDDYISLQTTLTNLDEWSQRNNIRFNTSKWKGLTMTRKKNPLTYKNHLTKFSLSVSPVREMSGLLSHVPFHGTNMPTPSSAGLRDSLGFWHALARYWSVSQAHTICHLWNHHCLTQRKFGHCRKYPLKQRLKERRGERRDGPYKLVSEKCPIRTGLYSSPKPLTVNSKIWPFSTNVWTILLI